MLNKIDAQPGDFGLTTIEGAVGALVNVGQAIIKDSSRYAHAFIVVDNERVVEAMPGGARLGYLSNYYGNKKPLAISDFDLSRQQRYNLVNLAMSKIGVPYSFLDYASLSLHHLGARPNWLKSYISDSGHMICSQLVDQVHFEAGVHLFDDGRWPGDVTPGDLTYLPGVVPVQ